MKKILCLFLIVSLVTISGCANNAQSQQTNASNNVGDISTVADAKRITIGMTLKEVLSILGSEYDDMYSVLYPYCYSWKLVDGGICTIVFEGDITYYEFKEKMKNGEFLKPGEEKKYDENGIAFMTEGEIEALRQYMLGCKATRIGIKEP